MFVITEPAPRSVNAIAAAAIFFITFFIFISSIDFDFYGFVHRLMLFYTNLQAFAIESE